MKISKDKAEGIIALTEQAGVQAANGKDSSAARAELGGELRSVGFGDIAELVDPRRAR